MDSGATCHMCNDDKKFATLQRLRKPQEVMLGDGHVLEAIGRGTVSLDMKLPAANSRMFKLRDVLYVPKLSYNLLSVSKAAEAGKVTQFTEDKCEIIGANQRVIAVAIRLESHSCSNQTRESLLSRL